MRWLISSIFRARFSGSGQKYYCEVIMSLSIVRFKKGGSWGWGSVQDDYVLSPVAWNGLATGVIAAMGIGFLRKSLSEPGCPRVALSGLPLLAPITNRQQLIFQVGNYHSHLREVGVRNVARAPNAFFSKATSALAPPDGIVRVPQGVRLLDYEVELGLVMARSLSTPTRLQEQDLSTYVAAITVVNDFSARDTQLADGQYFHSKSHRGFCPVGPKLVFLEGAEFGRLKDLRLRLWVNRELRQDAMLSDMVHPPHQTLSRLSDAIDLEAGDLVATGTPGGCAIRAPHMAVQKLMNLLPDHVKLKLFVGAQAKTGRYLSPGDSVFASISTIDGTLDLGRQATQVRA
jgi:2,4-didehydro-3-deoxy-L-rhamnonate hydrolase